MRNVVYLWSINSKPHNTFDPQNHQDIILDIAGNLLQIGRWTLKGFSKQRQNIALYLRLTRKNVDALSDRTLDKSFRTSFDSFCTKYEKLEKEYEDGIADHRIWGGLMKTLAASLTQHAPPA